MVQAIIFDCFGVLTSEGWLPFKRKYFKGNESLENDAADLGKRLNFGQIGYDEFVNQVAQLADVPKIEAQKAISSDVADGDLFDYIHNHLKPRYKIGLLSNVGRDMLGDLFTDDQLNLFDAQALSYETGVMKPSRGAYEIIAERLDVPINDCLFVDDQERFCEAARDAGMQAVWYKEFDQFRDELEILLKQS